MKILLIIFCFLLFGLQSKAQNNNPLRIEVDATKNNRVYGIVLENRAFVILNNKNSNSIKGEEWMMRTYDSKFSKINNTKLFLPRSFTPFEYKVSGDSILWLCFSEPNGRRAGFVLYRYNLQTGLIWKKYVKGSRKSKLESFEVVGNKVVILGDNIDAIADQMNQSNMPFGIIFTYPNISKNSAIISSISSSNNSEASIIIEMFKGDDKGVFLYTYLKDASEPMINKLENIDVNIIDGGFVESEDGSLFLMGTFNYEKPSKNINDNSTSIGTYIGKIEKGALSFFKTNEFSDYKNIYATLSAKEQRQIKNKTDKGKNVQIAFKMLSHKKAISQGDLIVMAAETYYPEYHYESDYDSRGYMYQQQVFDGYRTTNCIVSAYNNKGDIVWDNYMHTSEILEYSLQENVTVIPQDDSSIVLAYYYNGYVYNKTVNGNTIVFKKSKDKMETLLGENVESENYGRLKFWYDNYYVLSGYQVVYGNGGKKRKVYFFNLITFD